MVNLTDERDVIRACDAVLRIHHIFHWRNNTGAYKDKTRFIRYGKTGSSDFLGICPDGRFLAVECKRPGGRFTEAQREFLDTICLKGGVGIVAHSAEELIAKLAEAGVI